MTRVSKAASRHRAAIAILPVPGWVWVCALLVAGFLGFSPRRHHFESAGIALAIGCVIYAALLPAARFPLRCAPTLDPLAAAVPFLVSLVAAGWTLSLGPLSDDFVLQRWAATSRWTPAEWPFSRPLPLALWAGVIGLGAGWPALHAINVLLHAVNGALIGLLVARWRGRFAGVVAGVLFALFPASTEAVAWTAGVFDLAATMSILLAVHAWIANVSTLARTLIVVICCVAGLLSKETAIVAPALLVLIVLFMHLEGDRKARLWTLACACVGLLGVLLLRELAQLAEQLEHLPDERRAWKDLLVRPFAALAVPFRTEAGLTTEAYLTGAVVLALLGVVLLRAWHLREAPHEPQADSAPLSTLIVGAGWIVLGALPLLTQFHVSPTLEGSRYLYLPVAGMCIALSGAFAVRGRAAAVPAVLVLVLAGLYGRGLNREREVWTQAAATRDALLAQAAGQVASGSCGTLQVLDAPDNVRGAYVFREGLAEALSALPYSPGGAACTVRWDGRVLVPSGPGTAPAVTTP